MVVVPLEIDSVPVSFSVSVATTVSFGRWGGRLCRFRRRSAVGVCGCSCGCWMVKI